MLCALLAASAAIARPAGPDAVSMHRRASASVADVALAYTGESHADRLAVAHRWAEGLGSVADELSEHWQRTPLVTRALAPIADGFFTARELEAAVERNFLDAGLGVFDAGGKSGWQMGRVGTPRGTSFQDAKLTWAEVEAAQARGTVVFNSFGAHEPALSQLCLGAVQALGLPANLNLYLTKAGLPLSAPPHTDKQDVLVIQTQGVKHWRVYAPPEPALRPRSDPLARGKADDRLELSELGRPLLELDLCPGDTLYIPAAFPHTTSTAEGGAAGRSEPSVHLTLNVDSHIWALTYDGARRVALARAREADGVRMRGLPLSQYLSWQDTLPVGFRARLARRAGEGGEAEERAAAALLSRELAGRLWGAQPERWQSTEAAAAALGLDACAERMALHARELLDVQRRLYLDGALELTPTPHGVSLFRVRPYLDELEATMAALSAWAGLAPGALASDGAEAAAPGAGAGQAGAKAGKAKGGGKKGGFGKAGSGKGGFG